MFLVLPWKLRHAGASHRPPAANVAIIAISVAFYVFGGYWPVGPSTGPLSILLYAFSHASFWHLTLNMWTLWVFGNPVNRRLGDGHFLLAYLGSAVALGLFARLVMPVAMVGSSGAIFAVIVIALILMPAAVLEVACVALFPLTVVVGLLSKPKHLLEWLARGVIHPVVALWALALIAILQLVSFFWCGWSPTHLAHLLGMLCGLAVVLLLPTRVTMGRRPIAGTY
jgi:membrane associated rhomboid family serine protease